VVDATNARGLAEIYRELLGFEYGDSASRRATRTCEHASSRLIRSRVAGPQVSLRTTQPVQHDVERRPRRTLAHALLDAPRE
jgi:hypothetical protein